MNSGRIYCAFAYNVHDSSASFAIGNEIILVLEAERVFDQKKKRCDKDEMEKLILTGLNQIGAKPQDVANWAMTTLNNPLLTRSDIITSEDTAFPKEPYYKEVTILGKKTGALVVNHHLAHAASYLLTDFQHAVITTCDGGGDNNPLVGVGECFAVYRGDGNRITRQYDFAVDDLITGKTYATCAVYIYDDKPCEGKLMALAAFGEVRESYLQVLKSIYRELESVDYPIAEQIMETYFPGLRGQAAGNNPTQDAKDFCATVQFFFSAQRLKNTKAVVAKYSKEGDAFVLAGGTGLNLDLNTILLKNFPNMRQFISPSCDDTGQSLGALGLLLVETTGSRPKAKLPYLGMGEDYFEFTQEVISKVNDVLLHNGVLVLHNGKAEIGPRALGNRSLIGRADSLHVKQKLSEEIKQRESYRPVAPVTMEEKVNLYFSGPHSSPFMLYKYEILERMKNILVGAIHVDGSARVQTVTQKSNPFLYSLLQSHGDATGNYVLLNTSLNFKGKPIANTIEESLEIYESISGPKVLVYNGNIYRMSN